MHYSLFLVVCVHLFVSTTWVNRTCTCTSKGQVRGEVHLLLWPSSCSGAIYVMLCQFIQ